MKDGQVRRKLSIEGKMAALKPHSVDHVPVSDLCEEGRIRPSLFEVWQRQMREIPGAAFENGTRGGQASRREAGRERENQALKEALAQREARLATKDKVIAELSAELSVEKEAAGESGAAAGFPPTPATRSWR